MLIHCCGCDGDVEARLTDGSEVYPCRQDLSALPFWKCDACGNYVGCHHKTKNKTRPLGCISTPELKEARQFIHAILDPIWKSGTVTRKEIYSMLSEGLGYQYHTAEIRNLDEARKIFRMVRSYAREINRVKA